MITLIKVLNKLKASFNCEKGLKTSEITTVERLYVVYIRLKLEYSALKSNLLSIFKKSVY